MKLLTYRGESFLTGNEVADAVMRYSLSLSRHRDVDLINIPTVDPDGEMHRSEFLIGWLHEPTATSAADRAEGELVEEDTIVGLYDRTDRIGGIRAEASTDQDLEPLSPVTFEENWSEFDL
jgi:hypothetical protein